MNGSFAARLRTTGSRRFAAVALVAAPVLTGAWLFAAALPALADGGPHIKDANSGVSTLTADSCAGCHRAHTAQGEMLLAAPNEEALCLTCHGAAGTGATTDVMTGIQYVPGTSGTVRGAAPLGALRSGGFDQARIASGTPARVFQSGTALNVWAKVSVNPAAADVTSAHLNLADINGLTAPAVAWGNDGQNTGPGPAVSMSCASCHNPHGNGQYRILNPIPKPTEATAGTFVAVGASGVSVTDAANPTNATRNYTVIQVKGTQNSPGTFWLYASQVTTGPTTGDYWHVSVPWTPGGAAAISDAPNGNPSGPTPFNTQIETWCSACHTRYHAEPFSQSENSGDNLFAYRHQTAGRTACTTCHVAHGSNARMEGTYSLSQPFPNGAAPSYTIGSATTGDSRLLKVDNRGTCQLCHDPTDTVGRGTYTGPDPTPGVP
jgi:predicted CXXCH cytochrome family protein